MVIDQFAPDASRLGFSLNNQLSATVYAYEGIVIAQPKNFKSAGQAMRSLRRAKSSDAVLEQLLVINQLSIKLVV